MQGLDKGLPYLAVVVQSISVDGKTAQVADQFGRQREIQMTARRGKGPLPAVGETWIVDRTLGTQYTFSTVLNAIPPVVTGSNGNIPAVQSLLAGLEAGRLIVNQTEDTDLPDPDSGGGGGGTVMHAFTAALYSGFSGPLNPVIFFEVFDDDGIYDDGTGLITIPIDCIMRVDLAVGVSWGFAANSTTNYLMGLFNETFDVLPTLASSAFSSANPSYINACSTQKVAAGTVFHVEAVTAGTAAAGVITTQGTLGITWWELL